MRLILNNAPHPFQLLAHHAVWLQNLFKSLNSSDALIYWRVQVMYFYYLGWPHNLQNWELQPVKN